MNEEELIESIETVEKPVKQKRKASEKQKEHMAKIQSLAIQKKKENKQITDTINKFENLFVTFQFLFFLFKFVMDTFNYK